MSVTQLTVKATIPTGQYANLMPEVTVQVDGDYDKAKKEAMGKIVEFSQEYAVGGTAIGKPRPSGKVETLKCYVSEDTLSFDREAHAYTDEEGNVYTSGSKFASQYEHPFNKAAIIPLYAKKTGVDEQTISDYWKAKADASTTFGTALHQALETYGKYNDLSVQLEKPIGIHPTLLPIVEDFFEKNGGVDAVYEPFVADKATKRCGQIDRLILLGDKRCIIEDYKTNGDLEKLGSPKTLKAPFDKLPNTPIGKYTIQLSFYKAILEANGWTVEGLKLHHWNGEKWNTINLTPVEIKEK